MTCKDCIHHHDYSIGNKNICDRYDGYCFVKDSENPVEVCKDFINNDGTYENGSWHCPKCGKPVSEWGLCDECDSFELSADYGYDNARFNAYCKSYDDAIKQIWESVSK